MRLVLFLAIQDWWQLILVLSWIFLLLMLVVVVRFWNVSLILSVITFFFLEIIGRAESILHLVAYTVTTQSNAITLREQLFHFLSIWRIISSNNFYCDAALDVFSSLFVFVRWLERPFPSVLFYLKFRSISITGQLLRSYVSILLGLFMILGHTGILLSFGRLRGLKINNRLAIVYFSQSRFEIFRDCV